MWFIDEDEDGFFEEIWILVFGWGYMKDYYDWVVGLFVDCDGNYFIVLVC